MDNKTTWGNSDLTFSGKKKPVEKIETNITGKEIIHKPIIIDEHEILFDNPWLKVKKNGGFIYAERKGVDSIAFVLLDKNTNDAKRLGLVYEAKDPINSFLVTAFGGSIDDEKYHNDLRVLVQDETLEEAGFKVELTDIVYHGKVLVSTQMNQFCHLFSVNVDKLKQGLRTTKNPTELLGSVTWLTINDIKALEDWKAITIITKRMMQDGIVDIVNSPRNGKAV